MVNNRSYDLTNIEIEELLKSIQPHPSQQFYRSMKSAPWNNPSHLTTTIKANLQFVMTSLSIIALIFVLLFTPVGRAIADGIARFFTTIEEESFEVPEEIILRVTQHAVSDATGQVSPSLSRDAGTYGEEILKVEDQIGYDLKEFSEIPSGFTFYGISEFLEGGIVSIGYESKYGFLTLRQGLGDFPKGGFFDQVPSHEVQSVLVSNYPGEYVQGYFFVFSGDTDATWLNDPSVQRLRWSEEGRWFEIEHSVLVFYPDRPEYLSKGALIDLAGNLVYSQ